MKKLGVVVPIYNTDKYLRHCIESILEQTYTNIQLVLVDDGSTDESGKICDEYVSKDNRAEVIHQINKGKLPSRYAGVMKLRECDYVTFVDSDDWIRNDTFFLMAEYMEKGIDLITYRIVRYFDDEYNYVSEHNYISGEYNGREIESKIYKSMIWSDNHNSFGLDPSLCNKIVKYDILIKELEKVKNAIYSYGEDCAVTYPLMKNVSSMYISNEALYYHRQRDIGNLAEYLTENDYYKKLYNLYERLTNEFLGDEQIVKQIDLFFVYSAKLHLKKYGEDITNIESLVPFDMMLPHKRIIIYGASAVGKSYSYQINKLKYGNVVGWIDKNADKFSDSNIVTIDNISSLPKFDYVLIAVKKKETAGNIRTALLEHGVDNSKIIWKYT